MIPVTLLWQGEYYHFKHPLTIQAGGAFLLIRHEDCHEHVHVSTFPYPVELNVEWIATERRTF